MVRRDASDLYITVDSPPMYRVEGVTFPLLNEYGRRTIMTANGILACTSIEGVGIRRNLLEDLALKSLYLIGEMTLQELALHMGLNLPMVEELFQRLRKDHLMPVT